MMVSSGSFIGSGIGFPMRLAANGTVALSEGEEGIEEAIRLILGTRLGERPMRPGFGCGIHDYVFAPADSSTAGALAHEVRRSLARWEPRIELQDVTVTVDGDERDRLLISIRYEVAGTNDPRNLVFPFYVIPEEPS